MKIKLQFLQTVKKMAKKAVLAHASVAMPNLYVWLMIIIQDPQKSFSYARKGLADLGS